MALDLVIRNGWVVDGSGRPGFQADIGIARGRIVAIGRVDDAAAETINADGQVVTPGFIDGHTHMDAQVNWDPLGTCSCWHGVTTVVMGNCGFTLAPARPGEQDLVVRNLVRAEDIALEALSAGIDWRWETFPEFLDVLDELPMGINYAANVGHSALRAWAMGERAFEDAATDDDIAVMRSQLDAALRAGAIGFTTSVCEAHATTTDQPVASRMASWAEIDGLIDVLREVGHGVFEISLNAIRDDLPDDRCTRVLDIARSGVPTTFGFIGEPDALRKMGREMESIVENGGKIFGQSHCRGIQNVMSLESRLPFDSLPEWRELRALPIAEQLVRLRDPDCRQRLIASVNAGSYPAYRGPEMRKPNYDTLAVLRSPIPPNPIIGELAAQRRQDPVEVLIDLIVDSEGKQFFTQPIGHLDDESTILEWLHYPLNIMTFSDSGAHVNQIMDASIQTYFLAYWVRSRGEFALEDAVHRMTGMAANAWGFADRGMLRQGMVADINIFDQAEISPAIPTVAHDLPGGAQRLIQKSHGILATIVSGEVLLREGQHTGALPGQLLRASQH